MEPLSPVRRLDAQAEFRRYLKEQAAVGFLVLFFAYFTLDGFLGLQRDRERDAAFAHDGVEVPARVEWIQERYLNGRGWQVRAGYRFKAADGRTYFAEAEILAGEAQRLKALHPKKRDTAIRYLRAHPEVSRAVQGTWPAKSPWQPVFGLAFGIPCAIAFVRAERGRPRRPGGRARRTEPSGGPASSVAAAAGSL